MVLDIFRRWCYACQSILRRKFCSVTGMMVSPNSRGILTFLGARLALQVGGEDPSTKNLTKKDPPILQTLLDVVRLVSQFFLGLLACIFRL